jgi:hypothetical protein
MKKQYLILGGIAMASFVAAVFVRGFTDQKGWTTYHN